jgi:hypothetical protein
MIPIFPEGFPAGTLVKTPQGYVLIENIKHGDQVICFDKYKKITTGSVIGITTKITSQAIILTIDHASIITDYDQLLYIVPDQNWFHADTLQKGHQLLNSAHTPVRIRSVTTCSREIVTYVLSIKDHHNYFVSHEDILTHNNPILIGAATSGPTIVATIIEIGSALCLTAGCIWSIFLDNKSHHNNHQNQTGGNGPCPCGHPCEIPACRCGCSCGCGGIDQDKQRDIYTYNNGVYENASYHHQSSRGCCKNGKSIAPRNGQKALDNSIKIPGNGNRRVGVSEGQIVILCQTSLGKFHGFVISWENFNNLDHWQKAKNELIKAGLIDKKGNIL